VFDETELDYLKSQRLARIATVDDHGQPDNSPVGFTFDGEHFWVGGRNVQASRKYKDVASGHHRVALVIDDLQSVQPWRPRGIRVYGTAEIVQNDDGFIGPGEYLRIRPTTTWSWGLTGTGTPVKRTVWDRAGDAATVHS
jgi:pyridoxamine 5'-phosphate oxidase family protein